MHPLFPDQPLANGAGLHRLAGLAGLAQAPRHGLGRLLTLAQAAAHAPRVEALLAQIEGLTKPPGSLGVIEALAVKLGVVLGDAPPQLAQLVFAADHGLVAEGVSRYPAEVTAQMVSNILSGGAAISVLCAQHGVPLTVIDAGVAAGLEENPRLLRQPLGQGTGNALTGPAMSNDQVLAGLAAGATALEWVLAHHPATVIGLGEMGIGNSSSAALLMHAFTGIALDDCVGRGAGLDEASLTHKREVLAAVVARHGRPATAQAALAAYGGFEVVQMAGAMVAAARRGCLILVDGFIASSALLAALALEPATLDACVFCHVSAEAGHRRLLQALGAVPLLDLELRLGEGSGALLAWPLLVSAHALRTGMASFASAGVSGAKS